MKKDILIKAEELLKLESTQANFSWRIGRVDTFVDLILVELVQFMNTRDEYNLVNIVKYSVQAIYNLEQGKLDIDDYTESGITDKTSIFDRIAKIINELNNYENSFHQSINKEYNYLKVLRDIEYSNSLKPTLFDLVNTCINEY